MEAHLISTHCGIITLATHEDLWGRHIVKLNFITTFHSEMFIKIDKVKRQLMIMNCALLNALSTTTGDVYWRIIWQRHQLHAALQNHAKNKRRQKDRAMPSRGWRGQRHLFILLFEIFRCSWWQIQNNHSSCLSFTDQCLMVIVYSACPAHCPGLALVRLLR